MTKITIERETLELESNERAYNAGFVEASRLHGQEIERLRAALAQPAEPVTGSERIALGMLLERAANQGEDDYESPAPAAVPPYPTGEVVGPCVCGSWPGGKCLRCPVSPAPKATP